MNWDQYFLNVCEVVASNSKCLSRKVGAILVKDKRVLVTGYNGPPSGLPPCNERWKIDPTLKGRVPYDLQHLVDSVCPRYLLGFKSGEGLELCIAGHAERNCLITAAREGISTYGKIMYMNCAIPCKDCLIEIINAGIVELTVTSLNQYDLMTDYILKQSKIYIRTYVRED